MCSHYQALKDQARLQKRFNVQAPSVVGVYDVWPTYKALFIRRSREADVGDEAVPEREALVYGSRRLTSVSLSWTTLAAVDPFVELSEGRALFRIRDLAELADLLLACGQTLLPKVYVRGLRRPLKWLGFRRTRWRGSSILHGWAGCTKGNGSVSGLTTTSVVNLNG